MIEFKKKSYKNYMRKHKNYLTLPYPNFLLNRKAQAKRFVQSILIASFAFNYLGLWNLNECLSKHLFQSIETTTFQFNLLNNSFISRTQLNISLLSIFYNETEPLEIHALESKLEYKVVYTNSERFLQI